MFDLLASESKALTKKFVLLSVLTALSSAVVLAVINFAVEEVEQGRNSARLLLIFVLAIAIFVVARKHSFIIAVTEVERTLHSIRVRLTSKVRRADLIPLEEIGRSEIYASIQRETTAISQALRPLVYAFQAIILFVATMIYIAWLSRVALIFVVGFMIVVISYHFKAKKKLAGELREALHHEDELFTSLTGVLDGFKEVKMSAPRSRELADQIEQESESLAQIKTRTEIHFAILDLFSRTAFLVALGISVFLLPLYAHGYESVVTKIATALLYLIGPLSNAIAAEADLTRVQVAAESIQKLDGLLDEAIQHPALRADEVRAFEKIEVESVVFQFSDPVLERPFTVGPLNLTVSAGEIVFFTGGNGSGKTTLLLLLTSLVYPQEGRIRLDGVGLDQSNYQSYRSLFACVFSDYHLFDRLHGIPDLDPERVRRLLVEMELADKTTYADGRFLTLDLSSGQRRRLALVAALLEDKPIYVFDEWAADQDPEFRRKFYEVILPDLQTRGKTILAVTHDDQYYHHADRVLKLEEGRLAERPTGNHA